MNSLNKIILVLLLSLFSANSYALKMYWKSPDAILSEIEDKKAKIVLQEIYSNDEAWSYVISKIELGYEKWLDVAIALQRPSDAGTSSEIHDAMFAAIKNNTFYMLHNDLIICDGRHDPLRTYKEALKEIDATIESLKSIKDKNVESDVEFCTNSLEKSKIHLKRFFEIEKEQSAL